jgi:D-beta-D-heptose 7-phosphate kinase/D-beta-D-heptose 1-phosphate adenosyltransferase
MNFSDAVVLVIGDVMLDRYIMGEVRRISPEAPIPILNVTGSESKLGGAANVACNLRDLGCQVHLVSIIGMDDAGAEMEILCDGIEQHLWVNRERKTTVKTRYLSGGHQILRTDEETTVPLSGDAEEDFVDDLIPLIDIADVIVLSDYAKGVLTKHVIQSVIKASGTKIVIVDPKNAPLSHYAGATIITPNEKELVAFSKLDSLEESADNVLCHHIGAVLVTRSEKGMSLYRLDQEAVHMPAHAKGAVDVCGAGDTVLATLAACTAIGMPLVQAMDMANHAASIVVGKLGCATVSVAELQAAVHNTSNKLLSKQAAGDLVRAWKQHGLTVGFTNGCFDILHPGHVNMLNKCRAHCDKLIVGLNSDSSVQRLKGPERPIQSEESRAIVLGGLSAVDHIVIFEEDTPLELITALKPDTLMKGSDYTVDTVVGADVVLNIGGSVVLIDLDEGHSTTGIVQKLKR